MWPFTTTYPIRSLEDVCQNTYDYIVVGGGTAGSALASRLSDDSDVTVLLLEKGPFQDSFLSRIPTASVANGSYAIKRECIPGTHTGARIVDIMAAETLGGTSRINGMIYNRGAPAYYRRWGQSLSAWDWPEVEPYFSKVEETISLRRTENLQSAIYTYLERSAEALGFPVERAGNRSDAPSAGYFSLDLTIDQSGYRHSAFRAYLTENLARRRKDTLHICTSVMVSSLDLDKAQGVIRGVFALPNSQNTTAKPCLIKARREVVLTAGTICTPQILQLSGIGPLQLLERQGISVIKDIPGVGRHLADHFLFPVFVEIPVQDSLQHILSSFFQAAKHVLLYATTGEGWLRAAVDRAIYLKSTHVSDTTGVFLANEDTLDPQEIENLPDVEIMVVPIGTRPDVYPGKSLFTLQICLNQPKSQGVVSIKSQDPRQCPEIDLNMLDKRKDLEVARKALRLALRLAEQFCYQSGYPHSARLFGTPGSREWSQGDWRSILDDELDEYIKRYITPVFHVVGTCRMAKTEEEGVVDEQLRVHGFSNLRVADASVFPYITSSHPMAPTYMVAERCADFIRQSWNGKASGK